MPDDLVEQHLGLARMIAYEYANIPGASMDEIISEAENALAAAGRAFDPEKGQFAAYAGRAIRNALNSLFTRQLRYVRSTISRSMQNRQPRTQPAPRLEKTTPIPKQMCPWLRGLRNRAGFWKMSLRNSHHVPD